MPTGYTAGILDGTTKSFEQYAKQCVKAFGVAVHMREDNISDEFKKREPSTYHLDGIKNDKENIRKWEDISDEEIISDKNAEMTTSKADHEMNLTKAKEQQSLLQDYLSKAKAFVPPTKEHEGIAEFMVNQLKMTIEKDVDWSVEYHEGALKSLAESGEIDPDEIRSEMLKMYAESLDNHR